MMIPIDIGTLGKWFSAWVNVGPDPLSQSNCETVMQQAIDIGMNVNKTLQWYTGSFKASHNQIAGFLIAR